MVEFDPNIYQQLRFPEEPKVKFQVAYQYVSRRVQTLEDRIDSHLALLTKNKLFSDSEEPMDTNLKLEMLLENQNELQMWGQDILRMDTITQSYRLHDSTQFKKVRTIERILKANSEYLL